MAEARVERERRARRPTESAASRAQRAEGERRPEDAQRDASFAQRAEGERRPSGGPSEGLSPGERSASAKARRDWLALQFAGALCPRECTEALRAGERAERFVARVSERPTEEWLDRADAQLAQLGGVLLPWGSRGYPPQLAEFADAPPVLAVRGDPAVLCAPAVAIVGSRAASAYGLEVARRVAGELAEAGLVIVSGLAFGVDAAAHEAALAAGGRTVAIQACGLDRVYPAAHRGLAARIARSGAVATEFAIGVAPQRAFFPLRNRLISGLARALIVVEARERSGSLVTARHAADQGIDVFAVPGPITAPNHVGTNRLLRDGVAPLLETADVLSALAWPSAPRAARARLRVSARVREILDALRNAPASGDELAQQLATPPSELAPPLLELELTGSIARDRDGRWHALV